MDSADHSRLRQECWEKRFYSFGTAKIFERRARALAKQRRLINFLGLASPLVIGAFAAAFTLDSAALRYVVVPIAGAFSVVQAVVSAWAIVARWDERYDYAVAATKANTRLTGEFDTLAAAPRIAAREVESLRAEYARQEREDTAQHITDREKRYAMRSALFQYQSKCATCGVIPKNMTPSTCDSCGNF